MEEATGYWLPPIFLHYSFVLSPIACQDFMDFEICSPLLFLLLVLIPVLMKTYVSEAQMNPFTCSDKIQSCNAYLYQHNGHEVDEIASLYSVNASEIKAIAYAGRQDYLVPVNCRCENVNGTQGQGYFYDVVYEPKQNDIFYNVSEQCFSGQVWSSGANTSLKVGQNKTLYLLCGCVDNDSQVEVVTYTVQPTDTLSSIASLLSAEVDGIQKLNTYVTNPSFIQAGWLLYVPMEKYGLSGQDKGEHHFSFTTCIG